MQRIRLLGPTLVVLLASTLALAACNSGSVSGSNPSNPTNSTRAESKAPAPPPRSQGLLDAAVSATR
jgi:hypothetical protein